MKVVSIAEFIGHANGRIPQHVWSWLDTFDIRMYRTKDGYFKYRWMINNLDASDDPDEDFVLEKWEHVIIRLK